MRDAIRPNISYYCPSCYRSFKSLSHFNRYHSRCRPLLEADGRKKLTVKRIDGKWYLMKKTAEELAVEKEERRKEAERMAKEQSGCDTVKVGRSEVTAEWEIDEDGLYVETYWTKRYDENFEFIAKAEKAVVKYLEEKLGMKFAINGGTGSKGYRSTNANIK